MKFPYRDNNPRHNFGESLYEWMFICTFTHLNDTLMAVWVTPLRSVTSEKACYQDNKEKINNTKCVTVQIQLRSLYSWNPGVGLLGTVKQLRLKESRIASLQWWITDWSVWPVTQGWTEYGCFSWVKGALKICRKWPCFSHPVKTSSHFPTGLEPFFFIKWSQVRVQSC